MRVCLGGTFEPFHAGHKALLQSAAEGADELFVGITQSALAHRPGRHVSPWSERAKRVEAFLRDEVRFKGKLVTRALTDGVGPAATGDYDRIVASPETAKGALAINVARVKAGRKPLEVKLIPHVLGEDLLPLSATAVAGGLVDASGKRLVPVRIAVGSQNAVKVKAVAEEFSRLMPLRTEVRGLDVPTGVPEQPRDAETLKGAQTRAIAARRAWPECDYAIGIEAGLVRFPGGEGYVEAQACVVVDRNGWETHGWGPAFHYPDWVTAKAVAGEMVSDVLGPIANDPALGSTTGAIGYLSQGRLDRTALSRIAVLMAFVPRFRRDLYILPP